MQVRKLSEKLSKFGDKPPRGEEIKCKKCLLSRCEGGERCPAKTRK